MLKQLNIMGNAIRKSLFVAFLTGMLFGGFALAGTSQLATVKAATSVTGIIYSDTTWTKAGSPYSLTGPVLVSEGVTLTIEPGVAVNLNDHYIQVNGTLRAIGSSNDKIHINGVGGTSSPEGKITFTAINEGYSEQTGSGSIIENAIIDSTHIDVVVSSVKIVKNIISGVISAGASSIISNNIITGKVGASGSAVVSNNTITGSIGLRGGSASILNNTITGGSDDGITLELTESPLIFGNTISGCSGVGISVGGSATIERNLVKNNNYGISVYVEGWATIQNNTISNDDVGLKYGSTVAFPTISYNNFEGNSYNFYLDVSKDIDIINNWWGTTDTQAISQSIFDFEDDFNLGTVNFTPFLTEPNPEATPAVIYVPTTTPPPTTPPPTNSSTPTPTPSQEPQQALQFEAIEGVAIVVAVIGAGLGLLIYLIKRK
jgi:parallel beta-helix repeat protein